MKRKLTTVLSLLLGAVFLFCGCSSLLPQNSETETPAATLTAAWLASAEPTVQIYQYNEEDSSLSAAMELARGTQVFHKEQTLTIDKEDAQEEYLEILLEETEAEAPSYYYVKPENIAEDAADTVLERERFVRTPVTVYADASGAAIASFVKKGAKLQITGFDSLLPDGSVHKYKVTVPEIETEGWVYGKYLADTQEAADAVYTKIAQIHKDRIYEDLDLHGGLPSTLDWYPYARTELEGNALCEDARAMYLCAEAVVNNAAYLQLIKEHAINAVVIDIKDGQLAYASDVAAALSPTSYEEAFTSIEEYAQAVAAFQETGVYTIGRIVCFNDEYYAADHPETCIDSPESYHAWPSAYSRDAWNYNVELALEAVETFGFNEIQFDYVRFPENAYSMSEDPATDYKNTYDEEKAEAIQNFCFYAADTIHEAGAYFSVDVFGECADEYVSAYGQYWPAISNIVDAISGMPYTDHYGSDVDRWTDPYEIVYTFAERAANRQKEIETPAVVRTWITGYDTPNWNPTVDYNEEKMSDQINALVDAGLTGGFIPWNGGSNLYKYQEYAAIWDKTFTPDKTRTEAVTRPEEAEGSSATGAGAKTDADAKTDAAAGAYAATAGDAGSAASEDYIDYQEAVPEYYDENIYDEAYMEAWENIEEPY